MLTPELEENKKATIAEKKEILQKYFQCTSNSQQLLAERIKIQAIEAVKNLSLSSVQQKVFLKKPEEKDWCPNLNLIENMYGQAHMAC